MSPNARNGGAGVLAAVALGALLVPLNSTMVAVALPELIDDFDTELGPVSWLVTAYLIAMVALQPIAGRLGDRFGRGKVMVGGLWGFLAASIAAAAAPNLGALIGFRVLQAVAGALVIPNGMALIREDAPGHRLGSRLGLIGAALTLGAAAGPPLGGGLLAAWDWRAIFMVNVPVAALAIVLSVRALPRAQPAPGGHSVRRRLRRVPTALVAAGSAIALSNLAMYVTLLSIPLLLVRRPGIGSGEIGLVLACLSLTTAAASPLGGRLSDHMGRRRPAAGGALILALGLLALALDPAMSEVAIGVALLVGGVGIGLMTPALQTAALESVAVDDAGTAAGLAATSRYVGSIAGTLLLAGVLAPDPTGTGGFGLLYAVLATSALAALVAALLIPGRRAAPRPEAEPVPGAAAMPP